MSNDTENKHILVVEDIAMNRELVSSMLGKLGHTCDLAANGMEALGKLQSQKFDLVFMDLQMPTLNGYDTTLKIRQELNLHSQELPIIALTAHALPEDVARCFEAGMDDFLTKPVQFIELAAKVEEWLSGGGDTWDSLPQENSSYETRPLLSEHELKTFIEFIGTEKIQEAYEDFVNDNAAALMIMRINLQDERAVRDILHNITGISGNLGMKKLSLYTQHLLNQGLARDPASETAELDLLDSIFRDSCSAFERYLSA